MTCSISIQLCLWSYITNEMRLFSRASALESLEIPAAVYATENEDDCTNEMTPSKAGDQEPQVWSRVLFWRRLFPFFCYGSNILFWRPTYGENVEKMSDALQALHAQPLKHRHCPFASAPESCFFTTHHHFSLLYTSDESLNEKAKAKAGKLVRIDFGETQTRGKLAWWSQDMYYTQKIQGISFSHNQ